MRLLHGDCLDLMGDIPDGAIDLTVTSPPYDNLRTYNNKLVWNWDIFTRIADHLFRITKQGGVVVWIVSDATIKGSETGTSFKHALHFKDIGFNLHDTMIYQFAGTGAKGSNYCYWQNFEYMMVFSKGRISTVNRIKDHKNITVGRLGGHIGKYANGTRSERGLRITPAFSVRPNVWVYGGSIGEKTKHPAQFPEKLAHDHIISWSNEGDTVLDPMMGSGTTGKMAKLLNRRFIGIEKDPDYFKIATERINREQEQPKLFN